MSKTAAHPVARLATDYRAIRYHAARAAPAITMALLRVPGLVGVQIIGQWHDDRRPSGIARCMRRAIEPVNA